MHVVLNLNAVDPQLGNLLRYLCIYAARNHFMFTAAHIPEVDNVAADALSRNNDFFSPQVPQQTIQLGTWVLG